MATSMATETIPEPHDRGSTLPERQRNRRALPSEKASASPSVSESQPKSARSPRPTSSETSPPVTGSSLEEALIQAFTRAASDPEVSFDRVVQLFELQRELIFQARRTAYAAALAAMQPELPIIQERGGIKDRAGQVMTRYALWEDIVGVITPILARHGFSLSFRTGNEAGAVVVTGVLAHASGHEERTSLTLPIDTSGSKNSVQSIGSSTSYGKRYTASALLNLRSGVSEDDDGVRGGGGIVVSAAQVEHIETLIEQVGADKAKLLAYLRVESVADIPANKAESLIAKLKARAA